MLVTIKRLLVSVVSTVTYHGIISCGFQANARTPATSADNTWSGVRGVNINLDNLSSASKYKKTQAPSMNQLSQGGSNTMMGKLCAWVYVLVVPCVSCITCRPCAPRVHYDVIMFVLA